MRTWIGPWLVGISALHTLAAVAFFWRVYADMAMSGLVNTGVVSARNANASWFLLFGLLTFTCGLAVTALERSGQGSLPRSLGWALLGLAMLGSALMPASGFWLVFPPAAAILLAKRSLARPTAQA